VFFSHSMRRDRRTHTERLIEGVCSCLKEAGRRIFWDRNCEISQPTLVQGLRDPINRSRIAVLFINSLFWESPWAMFEMNYIERLYQGGRIRVLCVRTAPGEFIPDWVSAKDVIDVPPTTPITESIGLICTCLNRMLN
jgi:TIR domain